jgi:hypothetical protein
MHPAIIKLMAIAATLAGKSIRLSGQTLHVRTSMIHNDHGDKDPRLLIEFSLPESTPCTDPDCQCGICTTARSITTANANPLTHLMCEGVAPDHDLVLDSSFVSENGFHVKLRCLSDGRSYVGTGGNLTIALASATTAALAATP